MHIRSPRAHSCYLSTGGACTEVQKRPYILHSLKMFQYQHLFPQHAGKAATERHAQADKTRAGLQELQPSFKNTCTRVAASNEAKQRENCVAALKVFGQWTALTTVRVLLLRHRVSGRRLHVWQTDKSSKYETGDRRGATRHTL